MSDQIEDKCPECGCKIAFTLEQVDKPLICPGCSVAIDLKPWMDKFAGLSDKLDEIMNKKLAQTMPFPKGPK